MLPETQADGGRAIPEHVKRVVLNASFRTVIENYKQEVLLEQRVTEYATTFFGWFLMCLALSISIFSTYQLTAQAFDHFPLLAVMGRFFSFALAANSASLVLGMLGAIVAGIPIDGKAKKIIPWCVFTMFGAIAFGIFGVIPLAFIKF